MNKKFLIAASVLVLAVFGALVFYIYGKRTAPVSEKDPFIEAIAQSPAIEGNVINSGIAGKVILLGGGPYEYEASLEVFKKNDLSKPFVSVRSHSDGSFQIPLRPGSYVLKPIDPDGPIAPVRSSYEFSVGGGQWLQVKIEYSQQ